MIRRYYVPAGPTPDRPVLRLGVREDGTLDRLCPEWPPYVEVSQEMVDQADRRRLSVSRVDGVDLLSFHTHQGRADYALDGPDARGVRQGRLWRHW